MTTLENKDSAAILEENAKLLKENRLLKRKTREVENLLQRVKLTISSTENVNKMLTTQQHALEKYLNLLLENSPSNILIFDKDRCLVYCTKRFLFVSGYDELYLIKGKHITEIFSELLSPTFLEKLENLFLSVSNTGEVVNVVETITFPTHTDEHIYEISIVPILNKQNNFEGHAVYLHDNTDILQAKEDAEAANIVKGQFLANMSHEIRTPLNGISGLLHLVLQTQLESVQKNYIEKALKASEDLMQIINDILDFSKIESKKLTLENISFTLDEVVDNVKVLTIHKAEEKGLQLVLENADVLSVRLVGDPLRLKQILLNLVNNAIKFTKKGSVSITTEKIEEADGRISFRFAVKDTGIGLSEEQQKRLFSAFTQADNSVTRKYGGTGLGLTISKQLVELMGGQIWIESELGHGSTFLFTADFAVDTSEYIEQKIEYSYKSITNERHILLAEDNLVNQLVATELLKQKGYFVDVANNGQEAISMLEQKDYDLVLMDIQMPVMDGLEATKKIRENEKHKHLPIIALSANAMSADREKSLKHGMDEHITKPIAPNILYEMLDKWLGTLEGDSSNV